MNIYINKEIETGDKTETTETTIEITEKEFLSLSQALREELAKKAIE